MYKLREERLKNFYTSETSSSEVQESRHHHNQIIQDSSVVHEKSGRKHADSLADHSFMSLKSKEIRDSESPTHDLHFPTAGKFF